MDLTYGLELSAFDSFVQRKIQEQKIQHYQNTQTAKNLYNYNLRSEESNYLFFILYKISIMKFLYIVDMVVW